MLGKVDSKAKDVEVSEDFVSNIHHALRAVTMPTAERDIGNFLTDPIVSEATSDGGDGEGDELDEDGGDEDKESDREEDAPPKPKKKRRASKASSVTQLHVRWSYDSIVVDSMSE